MYSILIVDDNTLLASSLCRFLENTYECYCADSLSDVETILQKLHPDLFLLDLMLPDIDGLSLMKSLMQKYPSAVFIMMTAHGSIQSALTATRLGAVDYLIKPFEPDQLLLTVKHALLNRSLNDEIHQLRHQLISADQMADSEALGPNPSSAITDCFQRAHRVASMDNTVLLLGETGVGKNYFAGYIHRHSARQDKPFFMMNCAAVSRELAESELFGHEPGSFTGASDRKRGWLELAHTGTLVMDEIGELEMPIQAKLLTFFDQRSFFRVGGEVSVKVDTRIIATTNRDLEEEVRRGRFRQDLFYRLNLFPITVPPLRSRSEDIPMLVRDLLKTIALSMGCHEVPLVDASSMQALQEYNYPGNIRELRNILERALIINQSQRIKLCDLGLPASATAEPEIPKNDESSNLEERMKLIERRFIEEALSRTKTLGKAAEFLGISRHALAYRMKVLEIPARHG
ncbi:MAG: hypothetical protein CVU65_05305 [Deltaproteobacteria bacterium HGW-Deltaproteobacteria-22]|jgi:DNA-binding NtrC family response regulator|nr:MAG: hypothetical protein CVU65_05305 [Deltaproteobacteria bacterium HGW-Deltaproteobacteria-22]